MPAKAVTEQKRRSKKTKSANRLGDLRKRGVLLSQEQVGLLMVPPLDGATVSRHESGERGMSRDQIVQYARLYGVLTHEVFLEPEVVEAPDGAAQTNGAAGA